MKEHTIELSDATYQLLMRQSARLNTTPEELIERLLAHGGAELPEDDLPGPTSQEEALAALERLRNLFADVKIENLEELLNDPRIQLINVDLEQIAVRQPDRWLVAAGYFRG